MAISVHWPTRVITVPKVDTTLVSLSPFEIRALDLDSFRLDLKSLEDDEEGMPYPDTHRHIQPVTVGGTTLSRVVEIINNYTIEFENGSYAVNLTGANSNVSDVLRLNQVQVRSSNSAGLSQVMVDSGSGLSTEQIAQLNQIGSDARWTYMAHYHKREENETDQTITLYAADGTTPLRVFDANTDGTLINPRFVP